MSLHETLELLRVRRGISVREMAKRLKISNSTLARWLNGQSVPPWDKAERIAEFLGARILVVGGPGQGEPSAPDAVRPVDEEAVMEVYRGSELSRKDAIAALLAKNKEVIRRSAARGRKAVE